MKNLRKFLMLLLAVGLILGFAGCPLDDGKEQEQQQTGDTYAQYYQGSFRSNNQGITTIINNTAFDMLLFDGEYLLKDKIIGGVKAGSSSTTINFSNEGNFNVGGYKLLRAVRQSVYEAEGNQSKVDHYVVVSYRKNNPTTASIVSTTSGDYGYTVHNMNSIYSLQLRENSRDGRVVAFLSGGQQNVIIKSTSADPITLFPVWIGFSTQTMEIVEFAPTEPFTTQSIAPQSSIPYPTLRFPSAVNNQPVAFPVKAPTAVVRVMNTFSYMAYLRSSTQPYQGIGAPVSSFGTPINPGDWRTYNVESAGGMGTNLNIYLSDGNVTVPVRFEGQDAMPVLQDGYFYHISFEHITGQPITEAASYKAILSQIGEIDTGNVIQQVK